MYDQVFNLILIIIPYLAIPVGVVSLQNILEEYARRNITEHESDTRYYLFSCRYWRNTENIVWLTSLSLTALLLPVIIDYGKLWNQTIQDPQWNKPCYFYLLIALITAVELFIWYKLSLNYQIIFKNKVEQCVKFLPRNIRGWNERCSLDYEATIFEDSLTITGKCPKVGDLTIKVTGATAKAENHKFGSAFKFEWTKAVTEAFNITISKKPSIELEDLRTELEQPMRKPTLIIGGAFIALNIFILQGEKGFFSIIKLVLKYVNGGA